MTYAESPYNEPDGPSDYKSAWLEYLEYAARYWDQQHAELVACKDADPVHCKVVLIVRDNAHRRLREFRCNGRLT